MVDVFVLFLEVVFLLVSLTSVNFENCSTRMTKTRGVLSFRGPFEGG